MTRKGKGRQKIEMVKMKNESNLQVTFSKRKAGLFKKASELCTLCGAEVGLILFSPSHKVFSFGHPNVESVIDRFMNNNPPLPHQHGNNQPDDAHRNSVIRELNENFTKLENDLEFEKKKYEVLKKLREESKMAQNWWEDDVERFNLSQCKEFKDALENLKKLVALEASKFVRANSLPNFYVGSSSNAGFGTDGGGSHFRHDFDMFGPRMMVNNQNNMTIPGFDGGSGSQANHGFGVDVGSSQNNLGFDMFDPRRMVMNNQNNMIVLGFDGASSSHANHVPGFDGGSSSQANHGFGVDVGSSQNNPGFDTFYPRRMVNNQTHNPFINNPNMSVPHNTLQYGNNGNEGSVPDYNMNYGPEFNQNSSQVYNPNQNQISTSKRENMSGYDEHHRGNPPHPRRDYY